jgi:hypothetical protein
MAPFAGTICSAPFLHVLLPLGVSGTDGTPRVMNGITRAFRTSSETSEGPRRQLLCQTTGSQEVRQIRVA